MVLWGGSWSGGPISAEAGPKRAGAAPAPAGPAALAHEGDHLVRGAGLLGRHLAAGLVLERMHPVIALVALVRAGPLGDVGAALRVARPDDQVEGSLARPDGRHGRLGR